MKRLTLLAAVLSASMRSLAAGDTLGVFFRFNEAALTEKTVRRLDSALSRGPLDRNGKLLILGHTDALGGEGYNLQLSRMRALAVRDFLTSSGIPAGDIKLLTGVGERDAGIATDPDSRPQDRRVDIILLPAKRAATAQLPAPRPDTAMSRRFVPPPLSHPGTRKDSARSLTELAPGESLLLNNVFFFPGRHVVRPESFPALETLLSTLLDNPKMTIRIEGHVCCISVSEPDALDEDTWKLELSVNRALAIRSMLIDRGIAPARIQATGFGYQFPIVRNERNEEEANRNRRVEIRILSR